MGLPLGIIRGMFTNVLLEQDGQWMLHCSRPMLPVT
jgi:hypothetical protein